MIPWHIRCDLMSFNDWCIPFAQLTHAQKNFPRKGGALGSVNYRNSSTPFSYSSVMHDIFIQLRSMFPICCDTSLSYLTCMKTSVFSLKVWLYPIQEDIFFIVDWYVYVNCLLLNLTKFWQHCALVSKYTTWKWWHLIIHHIQVWTWRTNWNEVHRNFINFNKRQLTNT